MKGCVVENCYGHIWNNYGQAGLFGDNQGLASECAEFLPTGPCQLETSVMVGSTSTNIMVDALNTWVDMQENPSIYKRWKPIYEPYYIPMFEDGIEAVGENNGTAFLLSVYPNPTNGVVRIEGVVADEVQVYNALGQVVKTARGTNEIDLNGLLEGAYLLRITDADGKNHVARVAIKK
jgi:hypothetical protein